MYFQPCFPSQLAELRQAPLFSAHQHHHEQLRGRSCSLVGRHAVEQDDATGRTCCLGAAFQDGRRLPIGPVGQYALQQVEIRPSRQGVKETLADDGNTIGQFCRLKDLRPDAAPPSQADRQEYRALWAGREGQPPGVLPYRRRRPPRSARSPSRRQSVRPGPEHRARRVPSARQSSRRSSNGPGDPPRTAGRTPCDRLACRFAPRPSRLPHAYAMRPPKPSRSGTETHGESSSCRASAFSTGIGQALVPRTPPADQMPHGTLLREPASAAAAAASSSILHVIPASRCSAIRSVTTT